MQNFTFFNTRIGCLELKIDCYMASLLSNFVNKVDYFFLVNMVRKKNASLPSLVRLTIPCMNWLNHALIKTNLFSTKKKTMK